MCPPDVTEACLTAHRIFAVLRLREIVSSCVVGALIVEYLKELTNRADLAGTWDSWSTQYRVIAVIVGLLVAYLALRSIVPTVMRLLKPALLILIVLLGLWRSFPSRPARSRSCPGCR